MPLALLPRGDFGFARSREPADQDNTLFWNTFAKMAHGQKPCMLWAADYGALRADIGLWRTGNIPRDASTVFSRAPVWRNNE